MRRTRNELNNMTRIWTSESVHIRDIKMKMSQHIPCNSEEWYNSPLNHCFKRKSALKRDNYLEKARRRKTRSDS